VQRPSDGYSPFGFWFWEHFGRRSGPLFRFIWDLDVTGEVPDAPFVAAINHFSHVDPVIAGKVLGPVRYLATDEIYGRIDWFDRLITNFGAIPMSRTRVALGALRAADRYLKAGGVVGVFPEGKVVWTWGEATPKRGAAWLALRNRVPLVPVALWGTQDSYGKGARRIERMPVRMEIGPEMGPGGYRGHPLEASKELIADWESWMAGAMERLRSSRQPEVWSPKSD
jgi:1-acyl-sn-glycerol-3-phosphate acyltransferase